MQITKKPRKTMNWAVASMCDCRPWHTMMYKSEKIPLRETWYWCGHDQQVHCEDHRRDDPVIPHGHHQGVHQQPLPGRAHLQAEEHQQAGADSAQPTASVQVSEENANALGVRLATWGDILSERRRSERGTENQWFEKKVEGMRSASARGNSISNLTWSYH